MKKCTHCNCEFEGNFCPQCGKAAQDPPRFCKSCGATLEKRAGFCSVCGQKVLAAPTKPITHSNYPKLPRYSMQNWHKPFLRVLYFIPPLLFVLFAFLLHIFYKLPAVTYTYTYYESGWVWKGIQYGTAQKSIYEYCADSDSLFTAPLDWGIIAWLLAITVAFCFLIKSVRGKQISFFGKVHSLGSLLSLFISLCYFPFIVVGRKIKTFLEIYFLDYELDYAIEAAPKLIVIFSVLFILINLALSVFLLLCERGVLGEEWNIRFYQKATSEQLQARKTYREITHAATYVRFPWLHGFGILMLCSAILWFITACIHPEISPWAWSSYRQIPSAPYSYYLYTFFSLPQLSLQQLVWPNTAITSPHYYAYHKTFQPIQGQGHLFVEQFIQWFALTLLILAVLRRCCIKTANFAPQRKSGTVKHVLLFALLSLWNVWGYFNALYRNRFLYTKNLKDTLTQGGMPLLVCGILLLLLPVAVGVYTFRRSAHCRRDLSQYLYGENAKKDTAPTITIEELKKLADGAHSPVSNATSVEKSSSVQ